MLNDITQRPMETSPNWNCSNMLPTSLTPVEQKGEYLFKREDLYRPFGFSPVNGSKLRQCQILLEKNSDYDGLVTGTSIKSPQAPIVASVGRALNKPTKILYGGTTYEKLEHNSYYRICREMGSNIEICSKLAYTSVLNQKAELFSAENNYFNVRYGFDLSKNIDVFIDSVAMQTINIPPVENLVVTVGSAITIIGILYGIAINNIKIKKVYGIGCAPNRISKINEYANMIYFQTGISIPVNLLTYIDAFNMYKGYKYENVIDEKYEGITFHPRYEAKTFRWMKNQHLQGDTLMWITGSDLSL